MINMMNQEEFNSHNKIELYRIYVDLFKKVEEKDSIIKEFVISASQLLLKKQSNDDPKESGKISNQYNPPIIQEVRVRRFEPKEVPTKHKILLLEAVWWKIWSGIVLYQKTSAYMIIEAQQPVKKLKLLNNCPKQWWKQFSFRTGRIQFWKKNKKHWRVVWEIYRFGWFNKKHAISWEHCTNSSATNS